MVANGRKWSQMQTHKYKKLEELEKNNTPRIHGHRTDLVKYHQRVLLLPVLILLGEFL
jgi:hypothetical protein